MGKKLALARGITAEHESEAALDLAKARKRAATEDKNRRAEERDLTRRRAKIAEQDKRRAKASAPKKRKVKGGRR